MLEQLVAVILEKGGLFAALFVATLIVLANREKRWDARDVAKQAVIDTLNAARVADAQKTRDDVVAVNKQVVEVLTITNTMLDRVGDALDQDTDPKRKAPIP